MVNKGYGLVKSTGPAQQVQINFTGLYFGTEDESRDKYVGTTGKLDPELPFTDVRVRQAINKAIDRETLRLELYKGRVTPSYVHGFYDRPWDTWADPFDTYDVSAAGPLSRGGTNLPSVAPPPDPPDGTGQSPQKSASTSPSRRLTGRHRNSGAENRDHLNPVGTPQEGREPRSPVQRWLHVIT